jgi:GR25 family glycosyltransferase involved in LPS biosynthesis
MHYTPLSKRKKHMIAEFEKNGIHNFVFIENHDREVLTQDQMEKFANISPSEISLFCKHIEAIKQHYSCNSNNLLCVYEDDSVFCDYFIENLNIYLEQLKDERWDIFCGGECCNMHIPVTNPGQFVYDTRPQLKAAYGRGTVFYIIHPRNVKKIIEYFEDCSIISEPYDHWLNKFIWEYDLNTYWGEPVLVFQGSEKGLFNGSVTRGV